MCDVARELGASSTEDVVFKMGYLKGWRLLAFCSIPGSWLELSCATHVCSLGGLEGMCNVWLGSKPLLWTAVIQSHFWSHRQKGNRRQEAGAAGRKDNRLSGGHKEDWYGCCRMIQKCPRKGGWGSAFYWDVSGCLGTVSVAGRAGVQECVLRRPGLLFPRNTLCIWYETWFSAL